MSNDIPRSYALPANPDLEHLKNEAKERLALLRATAPDTQLADAQFQLARDYGFSSWRALKAEIEMRSVVSNAGALAAPEEIARRRAEQALPRKVIPFDPKLFDRYAGYYQLGPSNIFTITRDSDHFYLQLTGQVSVEVYPESEQKFFAKVVDAQISFTTEQHDNVTELVLHQNGAEQHAKRIDEALAKGIEAALKQRIESNAPSPGTETALRHHIESMEKGQPDYDALSPALAALMRQKLPSVQQLFQRWGALKSIAFKAVGRQGEDIYEVMFERSQTEWRINPLAPDRTINLLGVRELP